MSSSDAMMINKSKPIVKQVTVANNQKLDINCVGDIKQRVICESKECDITLKNVQYIPGICVNLLSVSQIVKRNCEVLFDKNDCKIFQNNQIIATGSLINNMFKLDVNSNNNNAYSANANKNVMLWHKRLAHINFNSMQSLLNFKVKNDTVCETCVKGKLTKKPFNNTGTRATQLLEIIHSDVCGPFSIS